MNKEFRRRGAKIGTWPSCILREHFNSNPRGLYTFLIAKPHAFFPRIIRGLSLDIEAVMKADCHAAPALYMLGLTRNRQGYLAMSENALYECIRSELYDGGENAKFYHG